MTTADQRELVAALLSVDGVADAAIEESEDGEPAAGPGSLRLLLRPGADEVGVATAVNRVLRDRFGLAVDSDRVAVVEEALEPAQAPAGPAARPAKGSGAGAGSGAKVNAQRPRPDVEPARPAGRPAETAAGATAAVTAAAVVAEAEARLERTGAVPPRETAPVRQPAARPAADPASERRTVEVAGAELPRAAAAGSVAAGTRRPAIERVEVVTSGLTVSTAVTLGLGARAETGQAEGMASAAGVHRTVATATLAAVQALVGSAARFQLEHVEIASAVGERTALALVTMLTERGSEQLSGSSVVRDDQRQAVIRAVLAAVNRRVEPLLPTG